MIQKFVKPNNVTPLTIFGLFAVTAMLVFYALEKRSPWFILAFASSCLLGSAYGFLQGAWPFGIVEFKRVDRRADIWAFGCVLYEMLTGQCTFAGETTSDMLAAVIRAEPDWSCLPANTPARVRDLLRRCLQKDPRQRWWENRETLAAAIQCETKDTFHILRFCERQINRVASQIRRHC